MPLFFRVKNTVKDAGELSVSSLAATGITTGMTQTAGALPPAPVPPAVIEWLQGLLRERFHNDLLLTQADNGSWRLSLPESETCVRLRCDFDIFQSDPRQLPCGHWLPQEETHWLPEGCVGLPTPGAAHSPQRMVEHDDDGYLLHYDLLSLAYWMLSRREEAGRKDLDPHGRFPAEASHAFRHGYLERPIVDEWLEVLRKAMLAAWPRLAMHPQQYSIRLSHDVDTPARYGLMGGGRLIRNMLVDMLREHSRDRRALMKAPWIWSASAQRLDPRDPFNTFEWIMDRSEEAGLHNAFYFICGRTDAKRDGDYPPGHPAIIELMRRIHARGHEIGLHPSYNTYLDPTALAAEAENLRRYCEQAGVQQSEFGVRMHYLRWQTPDTPRAQVAAGLVYDTTLGYAKHPGFRCGTCHEFQAFDPLKGEAMPLRLRPLIVMESTIIQGLRAKDSGAAEARMMRLMQACRRVRGCFTLLWHNTMLEHPHQRRMYERVLSHHRELAVPPTQRVPS